MAASYPGSVRVFDTKYNITDTVDASHPNSLQEEVVAIQSIVGTNPQTSVAANPSATFNAASTSYESLSARLGNIENGIVADSHTQYLRKSADGDSSNRVDTNGATRRGIIVRGALSQTANLQEWQNNIGVIQAAVTPAGLYTGTINASSIVGSVTAIPQDATIDQRSSSFVATTAIKNTVIWCNNTGAAITITIPLNTTAGGNFPIGSQFTVVRGANQLVTFAGESGSVTIGATPGNVLRAQWSAATVLKLADNTWTILGDLSA
jgi:hypothetical protein